MLEGDLTAVAVEVYTAVGSGITMCGQGVIGAAGIVACTLTGILAQEHATCIYYLIGHLGIILYLQNEMLGSIGIREVDGLLKTAYQYQTAVVECLGCHLLTGQQIQLTVNLGLNVEDDLLGGGDEEYLRVDTMLGLRQQVGCYKLDVGMLIGDDTYLGRTCGHVDSYVVQANLLLGGHDILVAGTEDFIYLGYALGTIGHSADGLYATCLEYLAYTCNAGCHQNGGVYLTIATWRGAEHTLLASCNLSWCGQHEYGREEWGGAARNVETNLLDGYTLLPANHAGLRLDLLALELLRLVEGFDIVVSHLDGCFQIGTYQRFGFVHLLFGYSQCGQINMVELKLVALYGIIAALLYVGQYRCYGVVEL